jgi:hypothetical protein
MFNMISMGRRPTGDVPKGTVIAIRADADLKRRFKTYVVETGFSSSAEALAYLLDVVEAREVPQRKARQ